MTGIEAPTAPPGGPAARRRLAAISFGTVCVLASAAVVLYPRGAWFLAWSAAAILAGVAGIALWFKPRGR